MWDMKLKATNEETRKTNKQKLFWVLYMENSLARSIYSTAPGTVSIYSPTGEFFPRAQVLVHRKHRREHLLTT